jgi:hypothetical protein
MGPQQVGGGIGHLGVVGPWAGYRVLKKIILVDTSPKTTNQN